MIAIEIKRNAQATPLIADLEKAPALYREGKVNLGVVIYFSSVEASAALDRAFRKIVAGSTTMERRLAIIRIEVPRTRISWGSDES